MMNPVPLDTRLPPVREPTGKLKIERVSFQWTRSLSRIDFVVIVDNR